MELNGKFIRRSLHRRMALRLPRHGARLTSVDRSNLPRGSSCFQLSARHRAPQLRRIARLHGSQYCSRPECMAQQQTQAVAAYSQLIGRIRNLFLYLVQSRSSGMGCRFSMGRGRLAMLCVLRTQVSRQNIPRSEMIVQQ